MIKNRFRETVFFILCVALMNCTVKDKNISNRFDQLNRTVDVGNWRYALHVENQNEQKGIALADHYLKATLLLANTKTMKSLLYSISKDKEDYEAKYKYLSFGSKDDLYIKFNDQFIYPIGYVFEPSNGLSNSEKLVYKFQINDDVFNKLKQDNKAVEYWYIDRMVGVGKICFKQQ